MSIVAGAAAQFEQCFENLRTVLATAGCTFADVVDMTTYHVAIDEHWPAFIEVKNRLVPRGVFPCAGEDVWCAIEVTADAQWLGLVTALGAPEWMQAAAYVSLAGRDRAVDEIERRLAQETKRFAARDLVARLQHHGVAAAVVQTSAEVADDPQLRARRYWERVGAEITSALGVTARSTPGDAGEPL